MLALTLESIIQSWLTMSISPSPQKSYFILCKFWSHSFADDSRGSAAIFMLVILFLSGIFIGIAIDYDLVQNQRSTLKNEQEASVIEQAINCRALFLNEGVDAIKDPQKTDVLKNDLSKKIIERVKKVPGLDIASPLTTKVEFVSEKCRVSAEGVFKSGTWFIAMLGFPYFSFTKKSVAEASLGNSGDNKKIEIDFIIDTSGSMSTIANPNDRDLAMMITKSDDVSEGHQENGCIFMCHSRRALLPGDVSNSVQEVLDRKPSQRYVVYAANRSGTGSLKSGSYNGGDYTISTGELYKNIGSHLPSYTYTGDELRCNPDTGNSGICTQKNQKLFMMQDVLDGFKIKLKSDVVYENMVTLISHLKDKAGDRTKISIHTFNNMFKTVLPLNDITTMIPLKDFKISDLKKEDFDYSVPKTDTYIDVPRRIALNRHACGLISSPSCSDVSAFAPTTAGSNGITLNAAGSDSRYKTINQAPLTKSFASLDSLRTEIGYKRYKFTAGKPNLAPNDTKRIVVLLTDGIDDWDRTGSTFSDPPQYECFGFKDPRLGIGATMMVVHSYYRFQPGSNASDILRQTLGGSEQLTRGNVDRVEKDINERIIASPLKKCANWLYNVQSKENYYFPANDIGGLISAFDQLEEAILGKEEDTSIRVVE